MKRTMRGVAALMAATLAMMAGNVVAQTVEKSGKTALGTEKEKVSYAIGMDVGKSFEPVAEFIDLSAERDPVIEKRRLAALRSEYDYWMAGASCLDAPGACQHVVRMPDGSLLNRYWDARDTPRDESYAADVATAKAAAPRPAAHAR